MKVEDKDNVNYISMKQHVVNLHKLLIEGKDDSDEANAIRDSSDITWQKLSEEERENIRLFSENLYVQDEFEKRCDRAAWSIMYDIMDSFPKFYDSLDEKIKNICIETWSERIWSTIEDMIPKDQREHRD